MTKSHAIEYSRSSPSKRSLVIALTSIVIVGLIALLVDRLDTEIANLEALKFELRLNELKDAVRLKEASLRAQDKIHLAPNFEGVNPMNWLRSSRSENPDFPDYLGEVGLQHASTLYAHWAYDPKEEVIAYLQRPTGEDSSAPDWLKFRVVALWSEGEQAKIARGLSLEAVQGETR